MTEKTIVENVNHPGHTERVDSAKYYAIRNLMLQALPKGPPGMTAAQIKQALLPNVPQDLFPEGKALGWWAKTVQLDLEAKGLVQRAATRPLTFFGTE
ncbi:DUF6958 family protein [Thalassococcus lentus]|uniref:Uncharacterized protein n=1 Tax=Thalassococcus lentus TaxID=1210524 RepID=A0ABT4XV05_9RHOB|nr:hypothetical protein [Thalassococcus lentus]MDA7425797.1 hypothetical protein [Thalassococcus lentus]